MGGKILHILEKCICIKKRPSSCRFDPLVYSLVALQGPWQEPPPPRRTTFVWCSGIIVPKGTGIVRFWTRRKAPPYGEIHWSPP